MTIQCPNCDKENKTFPSLNCQYKIDIVNIHLNKPILEIKHIVKLFSQMFKKIRRWYKLYKKRFLSRDENQKLMRTQPFFRRKKSFETTMLLGRDQNTKIWIQKGDIIIFKYLYFKKLYTLFYLYVILFLQVSIYYSSPPVQSFNISQ